ncbi:unnamed protein product [Sphenostylis stenocarpa]|uniref:AMP-activated protein kinase glycogen-binding domain-containing protein n=1 Tax=Sphenostylis stenocarpa TaxID=92480 RepID=A0AA86VNF7_9FABA|nr:unnamed protein product [Sphenostylis stenocarpa]
MGKTAGLMGIMRCIDRRISLSKTSNMHAIATLVHSLVPAAVAQRLPQNGYLESVIHERFKRVSITWNHAATNVAIAGSWDNWETTELLQRVGQSFVLVKTLPLGVYHYRFIVDGYLTHAPEFPSASDDSGYGYNILDLQDYIPEQAPTRITTTTTTVNDT